MRLLLAVVALGLPISALAQAPDSVSLPDPVLNALIVSEATPFGSSPVLLDLRDPLRRHLSSSRTALALPASRGSVTWGLETTGDGGRPVLSTLALSLGVGQGLTVHGSVRSITGSYLPGIKVQADLGVSVTLIETPRLATAVGFEAPMFQEGLLDDDVGAFVPYVVMTGRTGRWAATVVAERSSQPRLAAMLLSTAVGVALDDRHSLIAEAFRLPLGAQLSEYPPSQGRLSRREAQSLALRRRGRRSHLEAAVVHYPQEVGIPESRRREPWAGRLTAGWRLGY